MLFCRRLHISPFHIRTMLKEGWASWGYHLGIDKADCTNEPLSLQMDNIDNISSADYCKRLPEAG